MYRLILLKFSGYDVVYFTMCKYEIPYGATEFAINIAYYFLYTGLSKTWFQFILTKSMRI